VQASQPETSNPLTDGHLLRGLLQLAGPMAVSALLQNAQALIDLFWVGRIGSHAVAGVAVGGTIQMLLLPLALWLPGFLEPAYTGVWWAIAAAFTVHGILVTGWFPTGRWQRRKV
jgi:Na+-driven multidrug efflux pump